MERRGVGIVHWPLKCTYLVVGNLVTYHPAFLLLLVYALYDIPLKET